jgi:hypothetical protein
MGTWDSTGPGIPLDRGTSSRSAAYRNVARTLRYASVIFSGVRQSFQLGLAGRYPLLLLQSEQSARCPWVSICQWHSGQRPLCWLRY